MMWWPLSSSSSLAELVCPFRATAAAAVAAAAVAAAAVAAAAAAVVGVIGVRFKHTIQIIFLSVHFNIETFEFCIFKVS